MNLQQLLKNKIEMMAATFAAHRCSIMYELDGKISAKQEFETCKQDVHHGFRQGAQSLVPLVESLVEALEYTQRTDVRIGHTSDTEDGILRGMPDKIMMRNRCREALEKFDSFVKGGWMNETLEAIISAIETDAGGNLQLAKRLVQPEKSWIKDNQNLVKLVKALMYCREELNLERGSRMINSGFNAEEIDFIRDDFDAELAKILNQKQKDD